MYVRYNCSIEAKEGTVHSWSPLSTCHLIARRTVCHKAIYLLTFWGCSNGPERRLCAVTRCHVPNSPFGFNTHTDSLNVYLLLHFQKHVLTNRLIVSAFFAAKTRNISHRLFNDDSVIRRGIWSHEKSEKLNTRKTWPEHSLEPHCTLHKAI